MAKTQSRFLTQGFRRHLGVNHPARGGYFTFWGCVTWGLEQISVTQREDPALSSIGALGTETRKGPWPEDLPRVTESCMCRPLQGSLQAV